MASAAAATDAEHNTKEREEDANVLAADDEDTGAQVAPIVKLEEVPVSTGEEEEDPILDLYGLSFASSFLGFSFSVLLREKNLFRVCVLSDLMFLK